MMIYRRPPAPTMRTNAHPADDLSFMCRKAAGDGIQYWTVLGTGDYLADIDLGGKLGREYLAYVGRHPTNGNAKLLGWIVADMMACQADRGVIFGFMNAVNGHAMAAACLLVDETWEEVG